MAGGRSRAAETADLIAEGLGLAVSRRVPELTERSFGPAEGMQAHRHAQLGEVLPLDAGAAGRVLLAYAGEPGEPYESIRRAGYHMTFGERDPAVASIAAPVFGHNHVIAGAVAVTGPIERFTRSVANKHVRLLGDAAARLTLELGGHIRTVRQTRNR